MADGDWTADLDELVIPPDATDNDPRVYIGPNDPYAVAFGQAASIVFYWGADRAFMLSVEDLGNSGEFHLWSFDDDELKQLLDIVHDDNPPSDDTSVKWGQDDSIWEYSINCNQQMFLRVGAVPDGLSRPTLYLLSSGPEAGGPDAPDLKVNGISLPRGKRNGVVTTVSSAAIGAETVIATLPNMDYKADRAYEMRIIGIGTMSVATNTAQFRIKKTNTAGQQLANYGNWSVATTSGEPIHQTGRVFTVGGADVNATLVLSAQASAGTVTVNAGALFPRKVEIWDCGSAVDFPTEPVLV